MEHRVFISHSSQDKYIADAICHHLENSGIRCWIAPRDIDKSDWALSIMKGLHQSNVFVVVISHNSIQSQEVAKEVTEATHCCQYILPFRVDEYQLSERLRYHLGPCHWLDAVSPPLENRLRELEQRIHNLSQEDSIYMNTKQRRVVEKISWPRTFFVGREKEIEEIHASLEDEHVLFLQGMGGIGKSEIAKAYAKKYRGQYDTIIFANYSGSLLELVNSGEIIIENLRRDTETETDEAYFYRKLQILKDLSSEKTLLIIDNFDVEWDEKLEDVINGPYHLIITSRNEHEDYPTLKVDKIANFELVRQIFLSNYGKKLSEEDAKIVDEILKLVNCHTITVELIAKQMKASRRKAADMLRLLKETGVNTKLKEKIHREGAPKGLSSFDYICQMFETTALSEEEQQILRYMCMIPYSGMEISRFSDICQLDSYDELNSLIAKSWLMIDDETDYISIHPVICDVVKEKLAPSLKNCHKYVNGLWKVIKDCWYFTTEEREELAPYVSYLQQNFPDPTLEAWQEYSDFVNVAWMCGNFELSKASGHVFYDYTLKAFGPNTWQLGQAATYLAGAYHNSGDDISAEPFYKIGLENRLASISSEEDEIQIAISYSKLGRCAYLRHDFELAKEYLDKSMDIFIRLQGETEEQFRLFPKRSGDTIVEIERMYMENQEYDKALEYCKKSYDVFLARYGKEVPNSAYSLVDMGICCSALGRYEEAEEYLQRALGLNIQFNGEVSLQTVRTKESIADNAVRKGDFEDAKQKYFELEFELEKDFGEKNAHVVRIRDKRKRLEEKIES